MNTIYKSIGTGKFFGEVIESGRAFKITIFVPLIACFDELKKIFNASCECVLLLNRGK